MRGLTPCDLVHAGALEANAFTARFLLPVCIISDWGHEWLFLRCESFLTLCTLFRRPDCTTESLPPFLPLFPFLSPWHSPEQNIPDTTPSLGAHAFETGSTEAMFAPGGLAGVSSTPPPRCARGPPGSWAFRARESLSSHPILSSPVPFDLMRATRNIHSLPLRSPSVPSPPLNPSLIPSPPLPSPPASPPQRRRIPAKAKPSGLRAPDRSAPPPYTAPLSHRLLAPTRIPPTTSTSSSFRDVPRSA